MARPNPTRTPSGITTFIGGIALLAIFAGLIVLWITANRPKDEIESKRAAGRIGTRDQLETQYAERLRTVGWADRAQGVAHIPIRDAMKLVIADLKTKQPKASNVKVEATLPAIAAEPNSTEPPPPALPAAPQGADTIRFVGPSSEPVPQGQGVPDNASQVPPANAPAPPATPSSAPATLPVAPIPQGASAPAPPAPVSAPPAGPQPDSAVPTPTPSAAPTQPPASAPEGSGKNSLPVNAPIPAPSQPQSPASPTPPSSTEPSAPPAPTNVPPPTTAPATAAPAPSVR